jgi:hypothetical protein
MPKKILCQFFFAANAKYKRLRRPIGSNDRMDFRGISPSKLARWNGISVSNPHPQLKKNFFVSTNTVRFVDLSSKRAGSPLRKWVMTAQTCTSVRTGNQNIMILFAYGTVAAEQ